MQKQMFTEAKTYIFGGRGGYISKAHFPSLSSEAPWGTVNYTIPVDSHPQAGHDNIKGHVQSLSLPQRIVKRNL